MKRVHFFIGFLLMLSAFLMHAAEAANSVYAKCAGASLGRAEFGRYFTGNVITWDAVNGAASYILEMIPQNGTAISIEITDTNTRWYLHRRYEATQNPPGVENRKWIYRVKAINAGGNTIQTISFGTTYIGKPNNANEPWCGEDGAVTDSKDPNGSWTGLILQTYGGSTYPIAMENPAKNLANTFRINLPNQNAQDWKVKMVDPSDPLATDFRVVMADGQIMAIARYNESPVEDISVVPPTTCTPIDSYTLTQCSGGSCGGQSCGVNYKCHTQIDAACNQTNNCVINTDCLNCPTSPYGNVATLCLNSDPLTEAAVNSPALYNNGACPTDTSICAYSCNPNYTRVVSPTGVSSCQPIVYNCFGTIPAHAKECGTAIAANTTRVLLDSCANNANTANSKCIYECDTVAGYTYDPVGTTCIASCLTPPNATIATMCTGDSTGLTTPTTSKIVATCSAPNDATNKCEFTCNTGYSFDAVNKTCVAIVPVCTDIPSATVATVCPSDDTSLTVSTPSTVVTACSAPAGSAPKCEYTCNSGYVKSGNTCIAAVCTGIPSATIATVCPSDDTNLTVNTTSKIVAACSAPNGSAPKCEYTCNTGYSYDSVNKTCIPATGSCGNNQIDAGEYCDYGKTMPNCTTDADGYNCNGPLPHLCSTTCQWNGACAYDSQCPDNSCQNGTCEMTNGTCVYTFKTPVPSGCCTTNAQCNTSTPAPCYENVCEDSQCSQRRIAGCSEGPTCGNGRVDGLEDCDFGITMPACTQDASGFFCNGASPRTCSSVCKWNVSGGCTSDVECPGTACKTGTCENSECVYRPKNPLPSGCIDSARCGNGRLEPDNGETCDFGGSGGSGNTSMCTDSTCVNCQVVLPSTEDGWCNSLVDFTCYGCRDTNENGVLDTQDTNTVCFGESAGPNAFLTDRQGNKTLDCSAPDMCANSAYPRWCATVSCGSTGPIIVPIIKCPTTMKHHPILWDTLDQYGNVDPHDPPRVEVQCSTSKFAQRTSYCTAE